MPLLLLAIAPAEARPPLPTGLRGEPVICLEQGNLAAWATCIAEPRDPFGRADLVEHHTLISRLATMLDSVLPARFPTWLADEGALRAELERRQADLVQALARVRGRVEIAVTAVWTAPPPDQPQPPDADTPGRKYLLGRQQMLIGSDVRRERATDLADQIERLVGEDLVDVRRQVCPSATVAVSTALLVAREHAEQIKARLSRTEQDVRILVNGPWPPYTFATVV